MKRVLLLLPTTGYRNRDFRAAAQALGVEIVAAANYCHQLAPAWGMAPIMALHFDRAEQAADTVLREIGRAPDAVLAVDDSGLELAALLCARFGLAGNSAQAVRVLRDKLAFRGLLRRHGLPCPAFHHLPSDAEPEALLPQLVFPVVVKPRRLSASRGVIRADDAAELQRAVQRVRAIQARADRDAQSLGLVVEEFIPGRELALEGMLQAGALTTLALFDKPDPLDGPTFEETLYVTPSRLPAELQSHIRAETAQLCALAGLREGPVHAELRVNEGGVWFLEVAARSIGGLCSRALTHLLGQSLEALILRRALGERLAIEPGAKAAGVMMIPIPRRGLLHGIEGLEAARAVPGVSEVTISAERGQLVAPPPEGSSYLGFIFSRAERPAEAETALRAAHAQLRIDIRAEYPARVQRTGDAPPMASLAG
ncbi:MAG TPA: ATP-grasp domain-containing protein [Burkholderiales bacterium]|nr:ATP-grasp domain-containing protein [Burkholderiales bacterium]